MNDGRRQAHFKAGRGVDAGSTSGIRGVVGPDELRFLPQCLLSWANSSPHAIQGHARTASQHVVAPAGVSPVQPGHLVHEQPHSQRTPPGHEHPPPLVSLLVQYFNRPWMLPLLVEPFRRCASGRRNDSSNSSSSDSGDAGGPGLGIELLLNVDSLADAAAVAEFAAGPLGSGFVVPVYSANVHEIRSYNRLAKLARGKILIMLQDDDVFPDRTACAWLASVVRAFRRWPRLGAVGSQRFVFDYHPNTTQEGVHFWDPGASGGAAGGEHVGGDPAAPSGGGAGGDAGLGDSSGGGPEDFHGGQPSGRRVLGAGPTTVGGAQSASDSDSDDPGPVHDGDGGAGDGGGNYAEGSGEGSKDRGGTPPAAASVGDGKLRMQFVSIVDYAPIAVRRAAFEAIGGIDGSMSDLGQCGVHSDYDFTLRMWLAGWQVAYIEMPGLDKDPREGEGGTHRKGVEGYCWERQWELAIGYMRERWGQHCRWEPDSYYWFGSNLFEVVAEHVRLLNLRLLRPLAEPPGSYCPFGYGCEEAPVDRLTGAARPVSPLFGNLTSWPKHAGAPWAGGRPHARHGPRGETAGRGLSARVRAHGDPAGTSSAWVNPRLGSARKVRGAARAVRASDEGA